MLAKGVLGSHWLLLFSIHCFRIECFRIRWHDRYLMLQSIMIFLQEDICIYIWPCGNEEIKEMDFVLITSTLSFSFVITAENSNSSVWSAIDSCFLHWIEDTDFSISALISGVWGFGGGGGGRGWCLGYIIIFAFALSQSVDVVRGTMHIPR